MRNDIGKRLKNIVLIIVLIILIGMLGYKVIGGADVTLLDALYMTAITITTVGYSDVVGAGSTTAGKIFTIVYLFFSVGTIFISSPFSPPSWSRAKCGKCSRGEPWRSGSISCGIIT